jgi:hypothetical protein
MRRPPDKERGPLHRSRAQNATETLAESYTDERDFCGCGEPWLWRSGHCLGGHALPLQVQVRRGVGEPEWVDLVDLLEALKDSEARRGSAVA